MLYRGPTSCPTNAQPREEPGVEPQLAERVISSSGLGHLKIPQEELENITGMGLLGCPAEGTANLG